MSFEIHMTTISTASLSFGLKNRWVFSKMLKKARDNIFWPQFTFYCYFVGACSPYFSLSSSSAATAHKLWPSMRKSNSESSIPPLSYQTASWPRPSSRTAEALRPLLLQRSGWDGSVISYAYRTPVGIFLLFIFNLFYLKDFKTHSVPNQVNFWITI